jgi:serine/threonine protein kinase
MVKNNIDSYKIIRVIGEGGMSKIYEAENLISGNKVALKLYKPKISTSIFNNEVAIMTSLKHHNITRLIDYVEDEELQCIMMELLDRNNADGLRIYLARKNGSETVVCVLTNENPEGVITEIEYSNTQYGLNFGTLCPPGTGCNCDQNSLAKIVYGDLISYTPPAPQP